MASLVDDDDAWLYGDSNEEKKAELERINERLNEDTNGEPPTEFIPEEVTPKTIDPVSEEDKEAGELSGEEENKEINNQIEHGSEETDSDDDDDDTVQVTIGDIKPPPYGYSGTPVNLNIKRGTFGSTTTTGPSTKTKGIDMDSVGSINGVPVYEFNLDTLEDKPWRKPGADITDYFNYGFNEETWKVYCERQRKLRIDNNVVSKTQPATGKDQQIPVATVNENSKYSGLGGLTKKAGPPPGRKMSGGIDVIGGGTPSLPSRRPANSPRENVIQVIGRKGTFEPLPGMPPLHLPPPHMPPPFLLPPPEHNINVAPPGPVPPPGLPPPNIQATPSGNMGNQDGNFQDSFDSFSQTCYIPSHSVPGNDRQAHFDEMAGFYNGNQSSHNQFDMPSESTQQSWGNSPRDRERSREHDRERDREHDERERERDRNHNRSGYSQWEYSRDRSSGRSPAVEEEHERRRYREYHDRPRERERDHNWERDRERDERYERERDRESRRHRDHHRERDERYRDRSSRRRHQHEEEEHEHRSSRHKHKRSKREKEEENGGGGESQESEATNSAGGGKSSGTAAEAEEKSS